MSALAWSDVADLQGRAFAVEGSGGSFSLTLDAAEQLPDSGREGGSFRLEFSAPADRPLDQGTYRFTGNGLDEEIFVVPIARDANGVRYEAIFY